ncbi:MAG: type IV toxin-antitoxin system AbiEi family antitoxin [Tetrasphaera sp.]
MATLITKAPHLADWALSHGRASLTTQEVAEHLGVPVGQVSERMAEPMRRGEWSTPARGFWVPVPAEFRPWGAPPGLEIVDLFADWAGVDYYVGWLSAAQIHGAAHQSPQVFQVAVSRQLRDRRLGRTRFEFRKRAGIADLPVIHRQTHSGTARVATAELTALDVARDVLFAGGRDNAATVVADLDEIVDLDRAELVRLAPRFAVSAVRRLGWMLEEFGNPDGLEELRATALDGPATPSRLDPTGDLVGPLDARWNVRVNRIPEPDR